MKVFILVLVVAIFSALFAPVYSGPTLHAQSTTSGPHNGSVTGTTGHYQIPGATGTTQTILRPVSANCSRYVYCETCLGAKNHPGECGWCEAYGAGNQLQGVLCFPKTNPEYCTDRSQGIGGVIKALHVRHCPETCVDAPAPNFCDYPVGQKIVNRNLQYCAAWNDGSKYNESGTETTSECALARIAGGCSSYCQACNLTVQTPALGALCISTCEYVKNACNISHIYGCRKSGCNKLIQAKLGRFPSSATTGATTGEESTTGATTSTTGTTSSSTAASTAATSTTAATSATSTTASSTTATTASSISSTGGRTTTSSASALVLSAIALLATVLLA